jgi:hypothetical protein
MKCTPIKGYDWSGECDHNCPYWEGCKKELGLPKDWKPAKYKRVEISYEEAKKRGVINAYNTKYIYNYITKEHEPHYYKLVKIK